MNPELRRNLWLELTPHRLLLLPALVLVAWAPLPSAAPAATIALAACALFTVMWGARLAADAVTIEARERTWDIQRMSALAPWSMTWGKLTGATVLAWYGGGWCALIYLWSAAPGTHGQQLLALVALAASALAAQALAMTAALIGMHGARRPRSRLMSSLLLLALALTLPALFDLFDPHARIAWYGWSWRRLDFVLVSALCAAAWSVCAAYRTMCGELQVRTRPWLWPAFTAFTSAYLVGLAAAPMANASALALRLLSTAAVVACVQSYVAAFVLPRELMAVSRVRAALARGELRRAAEDLPLWLVSAACALACAAITAIAGSLPALTGARIDNLGAGALALACMMLRDVAILHWFSFGRRPERAVTTSLIYIGTLDVLLPALFGELGWTGAVALIMPSPLAAPQAAATVFAVHAALACSAACWLWRRRTRLLNRASDQ